MIPFEVWIRPLGDYCRVKVQGLENSRWLLRELSQSFIFETFDGADGGDSRSNSAFGMFTIPYNPPLSVIKFERLLRAMPEVMLMFDSD
ncbi:MAG: hypothetical protein O2955_09595 [Planctomycetota bacterium]|nr:hypothetical protein [Planctomycetota bacterium]MDA1212762.1 hypothetical protein [Planctomycetota bacterium]